LMKIFSSLESETTMQNFTELNNKYKSIGTT